MKAYDIIWGGNNKCEIQLSKDIDLIEGAVVNIEYDYIQEKYTIKYGSKTAFLELNSLNKEILDNIYLSGNKPATLVRIIDKDGLDYIIEIKIFNSHIQFNKLQAIEIEVTDAVVQKMRIREKENPIEYLNTVFKYGDMLFVKGYKRRNASFTILSKGRALHVRQENNKYIASDIVRYDRSKAEYDAVYILQGDISFTDSTTGAIISREVNQKMNVIASSSEYFDIWDAYNELDRIFALRQATESGVLSFESSKCELTDSFEYCFTLSGNEHDDYPDGQKIDCTEDDRIINIENISNYQELSNIRSVSIGTFDRIEGNKCYIIDRDGSSEKKIPSKGYLFSSVVGDAVRLSRRDKAKSDIIKDQTPIRGLALMIDKGVAVDKSNSSETAITKKLSRKFSQYDFNEEQRKAIEVAINTPDIGLILGPPGTGKTTVIKAIIARYEELFYKNIRKMDKDEISSIPKILVSSFQHVAVENVIVGMDGNGLPSERKGGRRNENNKRSISIREWQNKTTNHINSEILRLTPGNIDKTRVLRDKVYAWKSKGQDPQEGVNLLKDAYDGVRLELSQGLNDMINEVILRTSINTKSMSEVAQSIKDEEEEEIKKILLSQRTTIDSYADDGKRHAFKLKFAILQDLIDNDGDTLFVDELINTKGRDPKAFVAYEKGVEALKNKYLKTEKVSTAISDVITIEQCLKRIDNELEDMRLAKLENRDEATASVLYDFLEGIQDEHEIDKLISNYSNITAATCQQSMEIGRHSENVIYDLVIIDEAARANPLDLLIPMSMGRKVILVGDHKQLPHMLDPSVVKQFEGDKKMNELGVLEKSLFERLYRLFDNESAGIKRTARLKKQYRMNPSIGEFASEQFYTEYPLDSSAVDEEKKKVNLNGRYNDQAIAWINLDKNNGGMEDGKRSKYRGKEAERIINEVREILKIKTHKTIGIISFYRKQSEIIKQKVEVALTDSQLNQVEIGTVDAFQGKEFDIVFLSCVRANTYSLDNRRRRVGHIDDLSRLCVSFTRAKQLIVGVGDKETVECVEVLNAFIKQCEMGGSYYE